MTIRLDRPNVHELGAALDALRSWQVDGAPIQLHPGDVGWQQRLGAEATASALRIWTRDQRTVALALVDDSVARLTVAPEEMRDEELARRLIEDLDDPSRGVLGAGEVAVEAPPGALLRDLLAESGWRDGDAWTPLRLDLTHPVADPGLRIEVVGRESTPEQVAERVAVQRASFDTSTFTEERWRAMTAGPAYADARCLVGRDEHGVAVAAATVWSAGPGRTGLIEPLGTHRDHRWHGYGRAITRACAVALRELGSSSAMVCTPSSNVRGVATYVSAGYERLPDRLDICR